MTCTIHLLRSSVALAVITALGCQHHDAAGGPSEHAKPAPTTPAVARSVRVAPDLVDAGRIRTALVRRRKPAGTIRLPADIVASPEGAAEAGTLLSGRIARFEAREGDHVKRGQILAWLDAPEAAHALADVIRARTRTETQGRKAARLEGLVASEAATQVAFDEARLELELARADLAAARTIVTGLGLSEPPLGAPAVSSQVPVRSPVDGVVVERSAPLGAHVTAETRLFRLVSEGRVVVEARIADGANVVVGPSDVARVLPRGGARCDARILGVLPQVDTATRTRKARLAPDDACRGLVPGAQAEVELELAPGQADAGTDDVLVVPAAAVVEMKAAKLVFVRGRERGSFDVRAVEPVVRLGDDVVVSAGVADGESVVVEGAVLLKGELLRSELGGEE